MKPSNRLIILLIFSILSGCTIMDGNAIVTGIERDPVSPESVRLYRTPPENFEEIAIVTASAGHDFRKSSGLMNSAIERLKKEAAGVGANGILLTTVNERDAPQVTTTYGSASASGSGGWVYASGNATSVNRGDSYTRLQGVAIYVPQQQNQ